ncbi:unnamed protein product [Linum trigynum]|uniref:Uncharacterized protein n=1 Tax=Linum trigynum TaxID=586398 RepID=A0AAV2GJP4_9ROSI
MTEEVHVVPGVVVEREFVEDERENGGAGREELEARDGPAAKLDGVREILSNKADQIIKRIEQNQNRRMRTRNS